MNRKKSHANASGCRRFSSSMASGSSPAVRITATNSSKPTATPRRAGWCRSYQDGRAANQGPDVFAHKRLPQVADHYIAADDLLEMTPAVLRRSFGGLIAEMLAGEGKSTTTVTLSPAAPINTPAPFVLAEGSVACPRRPVECRTRRAADLRAVQFAFGNAVQMKRRRTRSTTPMRSPPQASHSSRRRRRTWTHRQTIRSTPESRWSAAPAPLR